jgi:hypothetical protein
VASTKKRRPVDGTTIAIEEIRLRREESRRAALHRGHVHAACGSPPSCAVPKTTM